MVSVINHVDEIKLALKVVLSIVYSYMELLQSRSEPPPKHICYKLILSDLKAARWRF